MMAWKDFFSSSVIVRKGLPESFIAPDLMTVILTPTLSKSVSTLGKMEMTPMLPVIVVGWAMMASQAEAI